MEKGLIHICALFNAQFLKFISYSLGWPDPEIWMSVHTVYLGDDPRMPQ